MDPITLAWLVWLLIWIAAWAWSKRARRRERFATGILHTLPFMAAVVLIVGEFPRVAWLQHQVLAYQRAFYQIGLALTVAGLAFAVLARFFLGSNWSAAVQVKDGHQLVRNGPYRFVRHPIYTGVLVAFLGTVLAQDQWRSLLAFALMLAGLVYKLRMEERFMTETFGDAYREYRRHTKALLPFVY